MIVTCPGCGRSAAVDGGVREVTCGCGRRFDPATRPTVVDPFLGQEISGYRVEDVIGSGGMGTVYRATQLSLGRSVALKVLPRHVADDPAFIKRFHREAQVLGSLSHPHIVQVIDRGESDGRYFIVMEYIDGESLRELLKRGPIPHREASRIAVALLSALDYAHEQGIVHRDVKPENVLVREDGVVKVADFGLSRVLDGEARDTRLTHTHLVLGTYEYMAPEQRESTREADGRADIYAAAVVFYEMLTGELPIGRFQLPGRKLPQVDRRIDAILERGLAKDPDDRFARAGAMGREIESTLSTPDSPVDLESLRRAAGRVARKVQSVRDIFRRSPDRPRPPTSFEMRLDLLLTILSVCGVLLSVTGIGLLIAEEDLEFALAELDRDYAGILVLIFGILLWNASERARKHWPGARTTLLALTLLWTPVLVTLPLTVWTWVTLLGPRMRAFMDARHRGLEAPEAAALAQGMALPERPRTVVSRRLEHAARANRTATIVFGCLAAAAWAAVIYVDAQSVAYHVRDGFVVAACFLSLPPLPFPFLAWRTRRGRSLLLNALVWSLLAPVAPRVVRRAWMLVRDRRDGLA